jgi:hypothetical protein
MNLVIRFFIVALATVFPKFKFSYGLFLIIGMTLVSAFCFFAAYVEHIYGQPAWIVRNQILYGVGASAIGWGLGLALMRQAKRHEAIVKNNLDEYVLKEMPRVLRAAF